VAAHQASVVVSAPVEQVFALFTHFTDFPKFMRFVKEVIRRRVIPLENDPSLR
jgi:uncharacterized membrane protein